MKIAVLGMGRMGVAIAQRLIGGGHQVAVWNRSSGKAAGAVAAGAQEASSIAAAVTGSELALSIVSDDTAVRAVALGPEGLCTSLLDGATYVECSTISPGLTEELAGVFPSFVAMPVLGGPAAVLGGEATYLAGGAETALDRLGPVLGCLGGPVRRYGSPGLASSAKLAFNLMALSGLVALAESFAVGRAGGLNDEHLRELLGGAVAPTLKNRFEGLLAGPWVGWWTTTLGAKDAGLAIDVARASGTELPLGGAARQVYLRAATQGYAAEDIAAIRHLYS